MARKSYVQTKIDGKWVLVPKEEYTRVDVKAPYVIDDIQPYRSMENGKIISSRSTHRAHLRAHNLVEVGNEKMPDRKPLEPKGIADDIQRSMHQLGMH